MEDPVDTQVHEANPRPPNDGDGGGVPPPVEHSARTDRAMAEEGIPEGPAVDDDDEGSDKEEEKAAEGCDGGRDKVDLPPVGPRAQGMTTGVGSSVGGAAVPPVVVEGGAGGGDGVSRGSGGGGVDGMGRSSASSSGVGGDDGMGRGGGGGRGGVGGVGRGGGGGRGGVRLADWVGERVARASSQARVPVTWGSGRRRGDEPKGKGVASSAPVVTQERVISLEDYVEHSRQEDVLEQARENPCLMAVVMEEMRRIREEEAAQVRASLAEEEAARAFAQEFEEEEAAEEALALEEEERAQGRVTVV